ncbi:MAG TPA: WhiB family transcriptional regulator [Propionibacteriaceae bacterium]
MNPWSQAACTDEWETFEAADGSDRLAIRAALAMCHSCPIIGICLETTLRYEHEKGVGAIHFIQGGLEPAARAALLGLRLRGADRHRKKATT